MLAKAVQPSRPSAFQSAKKWASQNSLLASKPVTNNSKADTGKFCLAVVLSALKCRDPLTQQCVFCLQLFAKRGRFEADDWSDRSLRAEGRQQAAHEQREVRQQEATCTGQRVLGHNVFSGHCEGTRRGECDLNSGRCARPLQATFQLDSGVPLQYRWRCLA